MNKQEALDMAREIGQDIAEKGRHPSSAVRWATAYTWWGEVVEALGFEAAAAAVAEAAGGQ